MLQAEERALQGHRRRISDADRDHTEIARYVQLKSVIAVTTDCFRTAKPYVGRRYLAGEKLPGMIPTQTGLGLARGDLGKRIRGEQRDVTPRFLSEREHRA
jgi:hypothetical protein